MVVCELSQRLNWPSGRSTFNASWFNPASCTHNGSELAGIKGLHGLGADMAARSQFGQTMQCFLLGGGAEDEDAGARARGPILRFDFHPGLFGHLAEGLGAGGGLTDVLGTLFG